MYTRSFSHRTGRIVNTNLEPVHKEAKYKAFLSGMINLSPRVFFQLLQHSLLQRFHLLHQSPDFFHDLPISGGGSALAPQDEGSGIGGLKRQQQVQQNERKRVERDGIQRLVSDVGGKKYRLGCNKSSASYETGYAIG
jgi:hypothetical protein